MMKKYLLILMLLVTPSLVMADIPEKIPAPLCASSVQTPNNGPIAQWSQLLKFSKAYINCPGSTKSCKAGQTCCPKGNTWVCCHMPQAVCCKDGYHCCPNGSACSADNTECVFPPPSSPNK